jgi:hypothetical protein
MHKNKADFYASQSLEFVTAAAIATISTYARRVTHGAVKVMSKTMSSIGSSTADFRCRR